MQTTTIDRTSFTGNSAPSGGALYFHNSNLVMKGSTLSGNTANIGGALFADGTTLAFSNDTFVDNIAQKGLGGAIFLTGKGGSLQNLTFLGNQSSAGSGYFAAAIGGGTALSISNTLHARYGVQKSRARGAQGQRWAYADGGPHPWQSCHGDGAELSRDRPAWRRAAGDRMRRRRCRRSAASLMTRGRSRGLTASGLSC